MRRHVLAALASSVALTACASIQDNQITIPTDSLRPQFSATASSGPFDTLRDYELRYTVDGRAHVVGRDLIRSEDGVLTYAAPESVPPGSLVTASWTARFSSGAQTSEPRTWRVPDGLLHDLQVHGVYFYVDEEPVIGDLARVALDGETDHTLRFVLEEGVPVRIRAVVSNNSGAVARTGVWLRFPELPGQEQMLETALGPGDAVVVVFDEVMPRRGNGVVVVDFGNGERPLDIDPSNDAFRTGVEIRS